MMIMIMMMMIIIIIIIINYKQQPYCALHTHTLRKVLLYKCKIHFTGEMTLHIAQIVNTEQLQHYVPWKNGLFQVYNCRNLA